APREADADFALTDDEGEKDSAPPLFGLSNAVTAGDDRDDVSIVRSAHLGVHPLLTKDDVSAMVHAIIRLPKGVRPIDILISNSVSVVWRQD
ncbi:unnamed protein product, partial [Amoebophrya sp. A25]